MTISFRNSAFRCRGAVGNYLIREAHHLGAGPGRRNSDCAASLSHPDPPALHHELLTPLMHSPLPARYGMSRSGCAIFSRLMRKRTQAPGFLRFSFCFARCC
jgi:hypothetical protein